MKLKIVGQTAMANGSRNGFDWNIKGMKKLHTQIHLQPHTDRNLGPGGLGSLLEKLQYL